MTRLLPVLFSALFLASGVCGATPDPDESEAAVKPVGMTERDFTDPERTEWGGDEQRPLRTTVWYPTDATQDSFEVTVGNPEDPLFVAGRAQGNPSLSESEDRYPLVLLSHGTGGAGIHLMWLATVLAENGYIVAAVNHHGNTSAGENYAPEGFLLWWERTRDLSAVLDHLLEDSEFADRIDPMRVGAAGFSLGGYTVISLAGGLTSLEAFEAFCDGPERDATCDPQEEFPGAPSAMAEVLNEPHVQESLAEHDSSFRDDRFAAVYAIAPALGGAFTELGLMPIVIPVGILGAANDDIAPVETNARHFADHIEGAELHVLEDAGHYSFLSRCTDSGRERLGMFCRDGGGSRDDIHQNAADRVVRFFDQHMN
ncbi:prolyl oligopeptidase family serine peptidase [Wenzhouxiangella sp. AB-CW3]|uniref:alpha/beta hydrolase family protein n=1 Tax=Wenzhouxiangella sp. AB-CW3 TaxID=2771012 RepID=UPI00168A7E77|nr:prolyl oligopeptidase family serine peptidase [Wenzhouxiangella sp. AB-CW3]QOC24100.1 prolyl oligopeptidase family serine peptidase [Wenzhouxiangella sp. AB-CW3]